MDCWDVKGDDLKALQENLGFFFGGGALPQGALMEFQEPVAITRQSSLLHNDFGISNCLPDESRAVLTNLLI